MIRCRSRRSCIVQASIPAMFRSAARRALPPSPWKSPRIRASNSPGDGMRFGFGWIMAAWALLVGPPLAALVAELVRFPSAWPPWSEAMRLGGLAGNTLGLVFGTLAFSMPLGVIAALLLYRTDLPGR